MIIIGLDDTDIIGSPGTNQLARALANGLADFGLEADVVLRHQLLEDARVPFTSQNGSASIVTGPAPPKLDAEALWAWLAAEVQAFSPVGSDPALALALGPPGPAVEDFGRRCQAELTCPRDALALAAADGLRLERLAGRDHGLVGALAAVGLAAGGDDGRVVHRAGWPWPDPFKGIKTIAEVRARGVDEVRLIGDERPIEEGSVEIRKHLRPARRGAAVILYVEPGASPEAPLRARKLP